MMIDRSIGVWRFGVRSLLLIAFSFCLVDGQIFPGGMPFPQPPQNPNYGPFQSPGLGSLPSYFPERRNLYDFGFGTMDRKLLDREAQTGRQVELFTFFPYYGAKFNYSIIAMHGYITFGNLLEDGLDFKMGEDVIDWPNSPDPATMAVYACRQAEPKELDDNQKGVYYRLVFRENMYKEIHGREQTRTMFVGQNYIDPKGDYFLDKLQMDLQDGMVGASNFRPDAALVVTWENMTFYQASRDDAETRRATYQAVWMTDRAAQLSYVILNYHSLGFSGGDILGGQKRARCKALFNGGNQTGTVLVDPINSKNPSSLASMSAVPHKVSGRYLFRVDDVVRRGGCSNMTAGTYRMTLYPDLVNSVGDVSIQVNGPCLKEGDQPLLGVAEFTASVCKTKNAAIAECKMNRFYQWGTKEVFLSHNNNKAYIGSLYYVPPGLDPFQLDVGRMETWYSKDRPPVHRISWHPGNFTNERGERISTLQLALYGYKEMQDNKDMKFVPELKKIAIINPSVPNPTERWTDHAYADITNNAPQYVDNGERELWTYSFGMLRLSAQDPLQPNSEGHGIWSAPIPLHYWWGKEDTNIEQIAVDKCVDWYNEDGKQWNFIMDTETNSSCPCRHEQAMLDIGRFLPHPRCSQRFRNLGCDPYIGAKECFLSAQNIQGNYVTHYGQVCCYDRDGYLMQTTYQTVVSSKTFPYGPGFPQRAYEFGTYPYAKQFEIPTLSNYFHDVMPFFFCCKFSSGHCQFFYWRRPSSACQNYRPSAIATVMGAGHFVTFDNLQYTFNNPGTYVLLEKPEIPFPNKCGIRLPYSPRVLIEARFERYPNRMVDFSHRDMPQSELVRPLNVSVITGVAIQEGSTKESDRAVIILRKDTRRVKYRLNVLVNDELRYFDVIKTQRFRGLTMYVNDWKEGQSEIYVALDISRIGLRIRESYAVDIKPTIQFEESYGLLDVMISIPPEFQVQPDPTGQICWDYVLAGLVGTYSNTTQDDFVDPRTRRSQGSAGSSEGIINFANYWKVDNDFFNDLFVLIDDKHQSWPEAMLFGPVYPYANIQNKIPFVPQTDLLFNQSYDQCSFPNNYYYFCPDTYTMNKINITCLNMYQCKYDFFETRQEALGVHIKREWNSYLESRHYGMQRYNSCGSINVEYPEYLLVNPPTSKLYLEGHTVMFECYQEHWLKGEARYECRMGGWSKGLQPWCRSKRLEITQKILAIIFGILLGILLIIVLITIFITMRSSRERRRKGRVYKTGEPLNRSHLMASNGKNDPKVTLGKSDNHPLLSKAPDYHPGYDPEHQRNEMIRRQAGGVRQPINDPASNGSSPSSFGKPPTYNSHMQDSPRINGKKTMV